MSFWYVVLIKINKCVIITMLCHKETFYINKSNIHTVTNEPHGKTDFDPSIDFQSGLERS